MPISPMQLSLRLLRRRDHLPDITERTTGRVKRDLFGFADIAYIDKDGITHYCQTTTRPHMAERRRKILGAEAYPRIKAGPSTIALHGWYKKGRRWHVKEEWL